MKQGTLQCKITKTPEDDGAKWALNIGDEVYINLQDFLQGKYETHVFIEQGVDGRCVLNRDEFKILKVTEVITKEIEGTEEILKFLHRAQYEYNQENNAQ